jgi:hypothetical protein
MNEETTTPDVMQPYVNIGKSEEYDAIHKLMIPLFTHNYDTTVSGEVERIIGLCRTQADEIAKLQAELAEVTAELKRWQSMWNVLQKESHDKITTQSAVIAQLKKAMLRVMSYTKLGTGSIGKIRRLIGNALMEKDNAD